MEERATRETEVTRDSVTMNETIYSIYIDFVLDYFDQSIKTIFIAQVNKEFRMREWAISHDDENIYDNKAEGC